MNDPAQSQAKPSFEELVRAGCEDYVIHGIGLPASAYIFHAVKLALFVLGWMFFCSFTPGLGAPSEFGSWWWQPIVFQKAFIWGCLVEVLGFACNSGPLGFRIMPPFTAFLHFFRPGTTKLPLFPNLPIFGGVTRTWVDVGLYTAFTLSLVRALVSPVIEPSLLYPIVILLPLCGLGDKTILLAARFEQHYAMILCFAFAGEWIAGCKAVQLAVWFWAGVSKLTVAFGYVVPIMTVNNPLMKSPTLRRRLFVSYPDDLSPSLLGQLMAHAGAFFEFAAPLTLILVTEPGDLQALGIFFACFLHGFILSNVPAGAVFEWNVLNIFTAFFLFGAYPSVPLSAIGSTPLTIYLVIMLVLVPLIGNFVPSRVSFLLAMRYYAGNWPWNAWMFRGDSHRKLDGVKRVAPLLREQLEKYAPKEAAGMDSRGSAFRTMHLQGRAFGLLLPKVLSNRPYHEYRYYDGELVAASVLGWNFGDGHLCNEQLLANIQAQCNYEEGELRVLMVESQPLFGSTLAWRIFDAKTGLIDQGEATLAELKKRAPWDYGPA